MKNLRFNHYIFVVTVPLLLISFLGGFFLKPAIKRFDFIEFFDSNFFVAIVTALVGSAAIFLYKKQKNDDKRDKARLILQEIRYAEEQIRRSKTIGEGNFQFAIKLLPTNSWHQNIHLFVNDLAESQLDLISCFYSQSTYLDEVIRIISDEKSKQWNIVEEVLCPDGKNQLRNKATIFSSGFSLDTPVDSPSKLANLSANSILSSVVNKIEFIYNSSAVDTLRDIADGKI